MLKDIYLKNSLIPKRYINEIPLQPSLEDVPAFEKLKDIKDNITKFVNDGNNLLICSNNTGCGKTTWATKIMKKYIEDASSISFNNQCPALFINITSFLNEKKLAISDDSLHQRVMDVERKILTSKLVIFDDLAVKDLSDYDMNNVYFWVDTRTNNMLSTIYTSNLLPDQLKEVLDDRIYSRVVKYSNIIYINDGDSREC